MKSKLHKHIRPGILVGWILAWNVLLGFSIGLNGGLGRVRVSNSVWPTVVALAGSCIFCFLLLFSKRAQAWALRPRGQLALIRKDLWYLALLTGGMAIAFTLWSLGDAIPA